MADPGNGKGKNSMPIFKRCSRCGGRVPTGQECPCRSIRHKEYDIYSRDKHSKKFYNSSEWIRTKGKVLDLDGMDVYVYMTEGRIISADTVHHIVPLRDDWSKRTEMGNLMSLNAATHSYIEQEYRADKEQMIRKLTQMLAEFRALITQGGV